MIHPDKEKLVREILEENKGSLINNEKVKKRINDVYLLLEDGYKFEEIASILKTTYWVVYYDIHLRLRYLDKNRYQNAKTFIKNNQKNKQSI